MRPAWLVALLALPALAGCLGAPPPEPQEQPQDIDAYPAPPPDERAPTTYPNPPPAPAATSPAATNATGRAEKLDPGPLVVLAHIDTGINPYHRAFRDFSALGRTDPSLYIPGYPADATPLRLSLDAPSFEEGLQRDREVWAGVKPNTLYWIPGTRIVGAISLHPGGTACPGSLLTQPALPVPSPVPLPQLLPAPSQCLDTPILDDHGHGTMTASRMAGGEHSLCPGCRIVSVEGLGGDSVRWASERGWIDVQTNSWGSPFPGVGGDALSGDIRDDFAFAAQRMLVFAASGNGVAFHGVVGEPTYAQATGAAGAVLVGAHDNGYVTIYQGQPPHVVADGYGGWRAARNSTEDWAPAKDACCTSAASPYAAGGGAALLLEARRMLGHAGTGWRDGVGAAGPAVGTGPLADGKLTLGEARMLLLRTAEARPTEGPDDGLVHPLALAETPGDTTNPGENPYCAGCVALPLRWSELPGAAPLYQVVGYGGISLASVALAASVLRGEAAMPDRSVEDAFFGLDQTARGAVDVLP